MANIMDYLDWRGDLSFEASEFNEVDNLILAQLVYVDFSGIVPELGKGQKITLKEASERFFEMHDENEILEKVSMTKMAAFVMKKMAETRRFGEILLSDYVDDISDEEQSQFSVVCITLEDGSLFVSFCGTDSTIVGWREDFNMGYLAVTPGQIKAVDYLNQVVTSEYKTVRVGGHSKGGNLSVYAAVNCKPEVQEKIVQVFSNDGPGVSKEIMASEAYRNILPRITTILPEESIVGMLLEHQEDFKVVRSTQSGLSQHDAMSWEVLGTGFVYAEQMAAHSILVDKTMKAWLYQLKEEERQQIVETIFGMLEEAQIKTVDDFYHSRWKAVQELMKAKSKLPAETQKVFAKALKLLWSEGNKAMKEQMKQAVTERNLKKV